MSSLCVSGRQQAVSKEEWGFAQNMHAQTDTRAIMEVGDGGWKVNANNEQHLPSLSQRLGKQKCTSSYSLVSPRCSTRPLFREMLDLATSPVCYCLKVREQESQCCWFLQWLMRSPTPPFTQSLTDLIFQFFTRLYWKCCISSLQLLWYLFLHAVRLNYLIYMVNLMWKHDNGIILLPMSWGRTPCFKPSKIRFENMGTAAHFRHVHLQKQKLCINISLAAVIGKRHYLAQRDSFVAHTQSRGNVIKYKHYTHKLRPISYSFQWETNTCSVHHPIILLHYFNVITMLILHVLFSFLRITFSRLLPPDAKC